MKMRILHVTLEKHSNLNIYFNLLWGLFFIFGSIGAELTLLRHNDGIFCVSDGNSASSALAWTLPAESRHNIAESTDGKWLPMLTTDVNSSIACDLTLEEEVNELKCPLIKNNPSWKIMSNFQYGVPDYGTLMDHRWEQLKVHHAEFDDPDNMTFSLPQGHALTFHLSLLGSTGARISLLEGNDPNTVNKYNLFIDARNGTRTVLKRFVSRGYKYIPDDLCKLPCRHKEVPGGMLANGSAWVGVTILVSREESYRASQMRVSLLLSGVLVRQWSDTEPRKLAVTKMAIHPLVPGPPLLWRLHRYNVLRPTTSKELKIPFESTDLTERTLCVAITYFSQLTHVVRLSLNFGRFMMGPYYLPSKNGTWYTRKFYFSLLANSTGYNLTISPEKYYKDFAIGSMRVCSETEYYVSKFNGTGDATCMDLTKSKESGVLQQDRRSDNFIFSCQEGLAGGTCAIRCTDIIPRAEKCEGITACTAQGACACLPGFSGVNCQQACQGGFGPECRLQCGKCRDQGQCDVLSGHCGTQGCEDGWYLHFCNLTCPAGHYGRNCSSPCGHCQDGGVCDHVMGECPDHLCEHGWIPPLCQIKRPRVTIPPQLTETDIYSLKVNIPGSNVEGDLSQITKVLIQYREEGADDWENGPHAPWRQGEDITLTLAELHPNMAYEVRAVLREGRGRQEKGFESKDLPVLKVATYCKSVDVSQIVFPLITTTSFIVQINETETGPENCVSSDYTAEVEGLQNFGQFRKFVKSIAGLEPASSFTLIVIAPGRTLQIPVSTEGLPEPAGFSVDGATVGVCGAMAAGAVVVGAIKKKDDDNGGGEGGGGEGGGGEPAGGGEPPPPHDPKLQELEGGGEGPGEVPEQEEQQNWKNEQLGQEQEGLGEQEPPSEEMGEEPAQEEAAQEETQEERSEEKKPTQEEPEEEEEEEEDDQAADLISLKSLCLQVSDSLPGSKECLCIDIIDSVEEITIEETSITIPDLPDLPELPELPSIPELPIPDVSNLTFSGLTAGLFSGFKAPKVPELPPVPIPKKETRTIGIQVMVWRK